MSVDEVKYFRREHCIVSDIEWWSQGIRFFYEIIQTWITNGH